MRRVGWFGVACTCALSILLSACGGDPPDREMQQAEGAIGAARAAGADQYAQEEFVAAEQALARAREAANQRDYRLALNHALDSRERAQNAAREAAQNKANARTTADRAIADATAMVDEARKSLKAAETARVSRKMLAAVQRATADGDTAVQEARAAFDAGDYRVALDILPASTSNLERALHDFDAATKQAPRPRKRRRR